MRRSERKRNVKIIGEQKKRRNSRLLRERKRKKKDEKRWKKKRRRLRRVPGPQPHVYMFRLKKSVAMSVLPV